MMKNLHPLLTIRLFTEEKCFGPGIAQLLERVEEHRSLRAAAQSMDMAYSKAWTIVKRCEDALGLTLLLSAAGGKHGGGASLTPEAVSLLRAYRRYEKRLKVQAEDLFRDEFQEFLP